MILKEASLDFAREHIESYYDSDFFPKRDEYVAVWMNWTDVKKHLTGTNVEKLPLELPRAMPAAKLGGGYRIVHQLEPLSAIVYTALAHEVAPGIEASRASATIAFAYRIVLSAGSFFAPGNSYAAFIEQCRELAASHSHVLATDVADFYNRIYIHRVENSIAAASPNLAKQAKAVEGFLMGLNVKASQGIPVGPAASVVLAEAVMTDVDQLLATRGLKHARYVDDMRVFANSRQELEVALEELAHHLFDAQRLQLSPSKTSICSGEEFLLGLSFPEEHESKELVELARAVCSYDGGASADDDVAELVEKYLDTAAPRAPAAPGDWFSKMLRDMESELEERREVIRKGVLKALLLEGLAQAPIDLGRVRHSLRQARRWLVADLADDVLGNVDRLEPAFPDVALYLQSLGREPTLARIADIRGLLTCAAFVRSRFIRHWVYWYVSGSADLIGDGFIGPFFWANAPIEWQMRGARTTRNLAKMRQQRSAIGSLGMWDRRAVIMASEVMPQHERGPWLDGLPKHDALEGWLAKWAKAQP